MDSSQTDSLIFRLVVENQALANQLALHEGRRAAVKRQLTFATYAVLLIAMILLFNGSLNDANRWQQLGYYTEKLDSCVVEKKIPEVFCHAPQLLSAGELVPNWTIQYPPPVPVPGPIPGQGINSGNGG